ncbi:SICK protein, partial [Acromyrmex insinuator]
MACIRAPRSVRGSIDDIKAESTRNVVQIYTDWANYYLERGGCKKRVIDLQADLCDGVLLADLVEAVTNQKVIDVNRKPKSAQQMVENVSLCVGALRALGADVGAVNPGELAAGSTLWPVLALLFALSRYKQRAKQLQDMPRLPSPYNKQSSGVSGAGGGPGGGTSIPLPATVAATRRCPPDKVRPAPAPTHQSQLGNEVEAGETHWGCSPPLRDGVAPHSLYFTLNSRVSTGQMCSSIRFTGVLNFEPFLRTMEVKEKKVKERTGLSSREDDKMHA